MPDPDLHLALGAFRKALMCTLTSRLFLIYCEDTFVKHKK